MCRQCKSVENSAAQKMNGDNVLMRARTQAASPRQPAAVRRITHGPGDLYSRALRIEPAAGAQRPSQNPPSRRRAVCEGAVAAGARARRRPTTAAFQRHRHASPNRTWRSSGPLWRVGRLNEDLRRTLARCSIWQGNCDATDRPPRSSVASFRNTNSIEYPTSNYPAKFRAASFKRPYPK